MTTMSSSSFNTATTPSTVPFVSMDSQYTAPLMKAWPYVKAGLSFSYQASISIFQLARQFMIPLPIVLYILAPFTVFVQYLGRIFIFTPYSALAYLSEALHPLYVFCGVACLTGVLLGVIGRMVAWFLVGSFSDPDSEKPIEGIDAVKQEDEFEDLMEF